MVNSAYLLIAVLVGAVTGLILSLFYRNALKSQRDSIENEKKKIIEDAQKETDTLKKEAHSRPKILFIRPRPKRKKN